MWHQICEKVRDDKLMVKLVSQVRVINNHNLQGRFGFSWLINVANFILVDKSVLKIL